MNSKEKLNQFKIDRGWLFETKRDFAQRWNISLTDENFYSRCIQFCSNIIDEGKNFEILSYKAHLTMGEIGTIKYTKRSIYDTFNKTEEFDFSQTKLYSLLKNFSYDTKLINFLEILECIINFYKKEKDDAVILQFNDIASLSNKPVRLVYNESYKFYPGDTEIFDKKLIDDVLDFLKDYSKAYEEFSGALMIFLQEKSYRDVIDKTRLALELFLKQLLNNEKSLEKQKEELNKYLNNEIHQEIKGMFVKIIEFYAKLNNENAKHNSGNFSKYEVEFLFYLVGNFMRLFMQIEQKGS